MQPRLLIAPADHPFQEDEAAHRRRIEGNLAHQALALVQPHRRDAHALLSCLRQARALLGIPSFAADLHAMGRTLENVLSHPDIQAFFTGACMTLPEQEIVVPGKRSGAGFELLRVDRVVLMPDNSLWVLDFKLGPGDPVQDRLQLRRYQRAVAEIFRHPCHGALIHLDAPKVERFAAEKTLRKVGADPEALMEAASRHMHSARPRTQRPIKVYPLHANLLSALVDELARGDEAQNPLVMAQAQVIFPHRRPKLHLLHDLAAKMNRPFFPPACASLEDWMLRQACLNSDDPPTVATPLDLAWLLYATERDLPEDGFRKAVPWHQFLPWGLRLARVMEELDAESITARNIPAASDQLPAMAVDMLARLGQMQAALHKRLADERMTTRAALARQASGSRFQATGEVFLCGLFALTASEAGIIHELRQSGARLWWQSDRPLPQELKRWVQRWDAPLDWADNAAQFAQQETASAPDPLFIQAHDLHSQLRHLRMLSASWGAHERIAVIAPEPSILRPLLAHLPQDVNINVTMGLPLERSALGALLQTMMRTARSCQIAGVDPLASDLLDFLLSPWMRRLLAEQVHAWLRVDLSEQSPAVLTASDLDALLARAREALGPRAETLAIPLALFQEALNLSTLADLCAYLHRLLNSLGVFEAACDPLERHAVHALLTRIIPVLDSAFCSRQGMPAGAVWSVFWTALREERAPLSGEPLTPWQVMGLLESRLLCFDRVVVLECVEGSLPRAEVPDPLLPEALRPALGLPRGYSEERITRHHFRRLLASAREVILFSRHGQSADPLEGRKTPSRYWEQLIWEQEQRLKARMGNRIQTIPLALRLTGQSAPPPDKESWLPLLQERVARGVSLSALNTYLTCPLRFFYEHVARFQARTAPERDPGAAALGDLAHKVLELLFRPYLGREVTPKNLLPELDEIWAKQVDLVLGQTPLSGASRFFHLRLLSRLLHAYLEKADKPTMPVMLEQPLHRPLPGLAQSMVLRGRLDRVDHDLAANIPLILDYKTGAAPIRNSLTVPVLQELTERLAQAPLDAASLTDLKETLQDLQLPAYLYLFDQPALCGFVQLGQWKAEQAFVPLCKKSRKDTDILEEGFLEWQQAGLPALMEWLGRHVLEAPFFSPASLAQSCGACPWSQVCPWAAME